MKQELEAAQQELEAAQQVSQKYAELKQAVQTAVAEEDYATAAKLQAELKQLENAPGASSLAC